MMNINLLIDAIVRQTTILIAHLATAAGARATLADTANQVFRDLVHELKEQGLGNKVIADMFGLTLRTYYYKVSRLSESHTQKGQSLWEAVLATVQERKTVLRNDILTQSIHMRNEKPATSPLSHPQSAWVGSVKAGRPSPPAVRPVPIALLPYLRSDS